MRLQGYLITTFQCVTTPAKAMTPSPCVWCQSDLYYVFTPKQWHPACFSLKQNVDLFLDIQVYALAPLYVESSHGSGRSK